MTLYHLLEPLRQRRSWKNAKLTKIFIIRVLGGADALAAAKPLSGLDDYC